MSIADKIKGLPKGKTICYLHFDTKEITVSGYRTVCNHLCNATEFQAYVERHEALLTAAKDAICHDNTGSYAYNLLLGAIRICEPEFNEDENDLRFREKNLSELEAEIAACEELGE